MIIDSEPVKRRMQSLIKIVPSGIDRVTGRADWSVIALGRNSYI